MLERFGAPAPGPIGVKQPLASLMQRGARPIAVGPSEGRHGRLHLAQLGCLGPEAVELVEPTRDAQDRVALELGQRLGQPGRQLLWVEGLRELGLAQESNSLTIAS